MQTSIFAALVVLLCFGCPSTSAFLQPSTGCSASFSAGSWPLTGRKGAKDGSRILAQDSVSKKNRRQLPSLATTTKEEDPKTDDIFFDGRTTAALVGGQSLLIVGSIAVAALVGTPALGLGPGFALNWSSVSTGVLLTLPLGILAALLDLVEDKFPALQDVTKATQRSVLSLLGGEFKLVIALVVSLALGCVAGLGEEMLFRGVLQYELLSRWGQSIAVISSSIIFGALHAVTPLYAVLATLASVYFGAIYIWSGNLAVPIVTHAFYDVVALLFAHWTVSRLSSDEKESLSQWRGPGDD